MSRPSYWDVLGIDATADGKAIRRQYAVLLKKINQQTSPDAFQQLREAYEAALQEAAWLASEAQKQEDLTNEPVEASPETLEYEQIDTTKPEVSLTQAHVAGWVDAIVVKLRDEDLDGAVQMLEAAVANPICSRQEVRDLFQRQIAHLCLSAEKIPYAFVERAASQFAWFDPLVQGENFEQEILRDLRARMLSHDASLLAALFKEDGEVQALPVLQERLQSERLQGLLERDYFEACLMAQIVYQELPLSAMQAIVSALGWSEGNSHLWSIAPQACEAFESRFNQLKTEQDGRDFEAHLYRVAANQLEGKPATDKAWEKWFYPLLPLLFGAIVFVIAISGGDVDPVDATSISLICSGLGAIAIFMIVKRIRTDHYPRIDIIAARNVLAPYHAHSLFWESLFEARQRRTCEWVEYIDSRYPEMAGKLDPQTLAFWRKPRPFILGEYFAVRLLLALSVAASVVVPFFPDQPENRAWMPVWILTVIMSLIVATASLTYLCSAFFQWLRPVLVRVNIRLAQKILPEQFADLPQHGMSCIRLAFVSILIGALSALAFSALFIDLSGGDLLAWLIVCPVATVITGAVYLWCYRIMLRRSEKTVSSEKKIGGFSFQWWHGFLFLMLARVLAHLVNP